MNNKKIAIVTGAAGSIGSAICEKFLDNDYIVVALDKDILGLKKLQTTCIKKEESLIVKEVDITDEKLISSIISSTYNDLGRIDVLVNNAGGNLTTLMSNTTSKEWKADIELNLNSAYYLCNKVIPLMVAHGGGDIVNISSVNGLSTFGDPGYSAAKSGLISLTKFIAVEYGKNNIRANVVCPGTVRTQAWDVYIKDNPDFFTTVKNYYPSARVCEPEDVANPVFFLCSTESIGMNGSTVVVDGGLTAGNPTVMKSFTE